MRLRRAIVSASYLRPSWYSRSADDLAGSWEIPGERCRHPNLPVAVSLAGQLSILICVLMFLMSTPVRAATSQSLVFLDGSDPTNLINDGACDPSAFPDRDRVVYVLHTRGGVWRLLYGNTGPPRYSSPSPDGRWLLFSGPGNGFVPPDCGPGTENGWFPTGCNYLYVANLMTDELLRLVDIPARFYQASFSPDASMIAYVRATPNHPGILKVMNSDGSARRTLFGEDGRNSGLDVEREISWSPDGTRIMFSHATDLWTVDILTGEVVQFTDTPARREYAPAYSPDGSLIAFVSGDDSYRRADIWISKIEDWHPMNVTNLPGNYRDIAWVPGDMAWVARFLLQSNSSLHSISELSQSI